MTTNIASMAFVEYGWHFAREIRIIIRIMGFFLLLAAGVSVNAAEWDTAGAQRSLEKARNLREELARSGSGTRAQYLLCAETYRAVYLKDPHYGGCDDAIYEQGVLYEEMGKRFGVAADYERAARLFRFLVSNYGISHYCPDALFRLGDLYAGPLEDHDAAGLAYQQLRSQYANSRAALLLARSAPVPKGMADDRAAPEVSGPPDPPPAQSAGSDARVRNIRCWTTSDYTRVVIDLEGEAGYRKTRLSNPDRIFFDISKARLDHDLFNRKFVVGDEFLKQVRVGQNQADVVRVVLDLVKVSDYTVFELHDPLRIVVDIHGPHTASATDRSEARSGSAEKPSSRALSSEPASGSSRESAPVLSANENRPGLLKRPESRPAMPSQNGSGSSPVLPKNRDKASPAETAFQKSGAKAPREEIRLPAVTPKAASPTSRGDRTLTRVLGLKIGRIVIDPGHGGHDTGTIGPGGTMEKDLVLSVGKQLKKLLEENLGAEVILTRDDDSFVSLEERTAIANQHQADLFLSIHANSSRIRSTSGVETYYLNFARTAFEREVAARENASTVRNVRDLQDLIKGIAEADKSAESRELAAMIQKQLFGGIQKVFPRTRNRGVRSAPFVVLIGANMPSVLVEVAFISNPRDEKLLNKEDNRDRLAKALYAGIESYMKTLGSDPVQTRAGSN